MKYIIKETKENKFFKQTWGHEPIIGYNGDAYGSIPCLKSDWIEDINQATMFDNLEEVEKYIDNNCQLFWGYEIIIAEYVFDEL